MNLRTKLVLALAGSAAVATIAVGLFSYRATATQLQAQLDSSIRDAVSHVGNRPNDHGRPGDGNGNGGLGGIGDGLGIGADGVTLQLLSSTGTVVVSPGAVLLPVDDTDRLIAAAVRPLERWREVNIDGASYRLLTEGRGNAQGAVQGARTMDENEAVLDSLRTRILVMVVLVIIAAAALAWLVARQLSKRLERLTGVAEQVATTGQLDVPVPEAGDDEVGRLGHAFNGMLSALARSKADQQRLVQDAGHELRTPLTSLRTNISALRRFEEMPSDSRAVLLDDLDLETRELTRLVNEVVEVATDRRGDEPESEVDLGRLVTRVADRVQRRTGRTIAVGADDTVVIGRPLALERAVVNLLDNACKFDAEPTHVVEVSSLKGRVEVRDHGPGVAEEDLPHLFDRFFRSVASRSRPGSGLGLSIVSDIVATHGGTVFAHNRPDGGACIGFELPLP